MAATAITEMAPSQWAKIQCGGSWESSSTPTLSGGSRPLSRTVLFQVGQRSNAWVDGKLWHEGRRAICNQDGGLEGSNQIQTLHGWKVRQHESVYLLFIIVVVYLPTLFL